MQFSFLFFRLSFYLCLGPSLRPTNTQLWFHAYSPPSCQVTEVDIPNKWVQVP